MNMYTYAKKWVRNKRTSQNFSFYATWTKKDLDESLFFLTIWVLSISVDESQQEHC